MTERELRIGNFVQVENELLPELKGVILEVLSIKEHQSEERYHAHLRRTDKPINSFAINYWQFLNFIKPIPIAAEWLERFGDISLYEFTHDDDTKEFQFRFKTLFFHVEYVHQLQNLYYALTNEELTLKTESK